MSNKNYIGQKVCFLESADHIYAHVAVIDDKVYRITEGGQLVVTDPQEYIPEAWNFVYDNKNPGIDPGVHYAGNIDLPELFDNEEGVAQ